MTTKEFSVCSSDGSSAYTVVVEWNGNDLTVACNCKAGSIGEWCRHKSGVLNGDEAILATKDDLSNVVQWVKASPISSAILDLRTAENQLSEVEALLKRNKAKLHAAKKVVANLINPHLNR